MLLGDFELSTFCNETTDLLQMVGWVVTIFKILIPLIIVIFGMLDFGKAVTAGKDEEIKNSAKSLGYRIAAGIIIFFIPSICLWIFGTIDSYSNGKEGFEKCETCILHPTECKSSTKKK